MRDADPQGETPPYPPLSIFVEHWAVCVMHPMSIVRAMARLALPLVMNH